MNNEDLKATLEKVLAEWEQQSGQSFTAEVREIVQTNLDRGRIEKRFGEISLPTEEQLAAYVALVANYYQQHHVLLHKLQKGREQANEEWEQLWGSFYEWAYSYLRKKNFSGGSETAVFAENYTQEAAVAFFHAYYPYDVPFDAWARLLVINTCRRQMRQAMTDKETANRESVVLEDNLTAVADQVSATLEQEELRQRLKTAVRQLNSEAAQYVITRHYFDGVPLKEIAVEMGKTPGSVHSIHFRALKSLLQLWQNDGNTKD